MASQPQQQNHRPRPAPQQHPQHQQQQQQQQWNQSSYQGQRPYPHDDYGDNSGRRPEARLAGTQQPQVEQSSRFDPRYNNNNNNNDHLYNHRPPSQPVQNDARIAPKSPVRLTPVPPPPLNNQTSPSHRNVVRQQTIPTEGQTNMAPASPRYQRPSEPAIRSNPNLSAEFQQMALSSDPAAGRDGMNSSPSNSNRQPPYYPQQKFRAGSVPGPQPAAPNSEQVGPTGRARHESVPNLGRRSPQRQNVGPGIGASTSQGKPGYYGQHHQHQQQQQLSEDFQWQQQSSRPNGGYNSGSADRDVSPSKQLPYPNTDDVMLIRDNYNQQSQVQAQPQYQYQQQQSQNGSPPRNRPSNDYSTGGNSYVNPPPVTYSQQQQQKYQAGETRSESSRQQFRNSTERPVVPNNVSPGRAPPKNPQYQNQNQPTHTQSNPQQYQQQRPQQYQNQPGYDRRSSESQGPVRHSPGFQTERLGTAAPIANLPPPQSSTALHKLPDQNSSGPKSERPLNQQRISPDSSGSRNSGQPLDQYQQHQQQNSSPSSTGYRENGRSNYQPEIRGQYSPQYSPHSNPQGISPSRQQNGDSYFQGQSQYEQPPNHYPQQQQPAQQSMGRQDPVGSPQRDIEPYDLQPKPVPHRQYGTSSDTVTTVGSSSSGEGAVSREPQSITVNDLEGLRQHAQMSPNDCQVQLDFAKALVEACNILASSYTDPQTPPRPSAPGARVDPKTEARNREVWTAQAYKIIKRLAFTNTTGITEKVQGDAMFYLASSYGSGGLGLEPDHARAYELYHKTAMRMNHGESAYRLAVCNEIGVGVKQDTLKAMAWYKKAAQLGNPSAMYKLGMMSFYGLLGQPQNQAEGITWLQRAAEKADKENPHALHELALLYERSEPASNIPDQQQQQPSIISQDFKKAFDLFLRAAKLGYAPSQFRLGSCYEYGTLGCPVNARRSIAWYTRAASEHDDPESELALSGWYLTGSNGILDQSDTEAYLWARKAADRGLAKAEYALAYFTEVGIGVEPDMDEARKWYFKAAAKKHPKALARLQDLRSEQSQQF